MSESFPLPTEPEGVIPSLVELFNSGKVEAMMALYAPEAVFVAKDGRTITDCTEIAAQFQRDMSLGLPLKANVCHVFVGGDTARSWWTGQLTAKVQTARMFTLEARQRLSRHRPRVASTPSREKGSKKP